MTPWYLLQSAPAAAAYNMAVDEVLLEICPRLGQPVLRFYGWTEAAATFGLFQKFAEMAQCTPLRPLVRRPTGGGLVCHALDWTYSLALPPTHPWYGLPAVESYRLLHEWLQTAWALLEVATVLAPSARREAPGQCFVGAEKYDLLCAGRKIAGAAQRRTRQGLLTQGSVQAGSCGVARPDWQRALCEAGRSRWGIEWIPWEPGTELQRRINQLNCDKYAQPAYNQRR